MPSRLALPSRHPSMPRMLVPKARIPWRHLVVFGWMPSVIKKWAYRTFLGYRIGRRVSLGLGSAVIGEHVDLGDDVEIGLLALVQGRRISIGRHSSVGTFTYISCETIEIGEDARIREQVFIGGPQLPESRFTLGDRTIVLQMSYINPTKPVTIGDDSGIGGHCLIFTHGSWLSALEGYPVTYEPVTIGKSVWLPWRVFVMPGASIGDGSVIGADSLVSGAIPPGSLAVGSPAKVVRSAPDFPRPVSGERRSALVAEMIGEFERYVAHAGIVVGGDAARRTYARRGEVHQLIWSRANEPLPAATAGATLLSERTLTEGDRASLRTAGVDWLDLGGKTRSRNGTALTEELAQFLGRYGIRLARDA